VRLDRRLDRTVLARSLAEPALATTVWQSGWSLVLAGHEGALSSAAFSPDGTRIVTASNDNSVRIWDGVGIELVVLHGHEDLVLSVAFSPDGTRIVTASKDKTARIWDAAAGNELVVLRGHEDRVQSAAFSPDGARIVTALSDMTVRIWDVHVATMTARELVAESCSRRLRGITTLSRDEMRLAGHPDDMREIDVCAE
jgi:WD40 repeat protein